MSFIGKATIVAALLVAIVGAIYLKGQQKQAAKSVERAQQQASVPATTDVTTTPEKPAEPAPRRQSPSTSPVKPSTPPKAAPAVKTPPAVAPEKPVKLPRLLELGADKCVPCKMMQPVLAELRRGYAGKLQVDFIDVWKEPEEGKQYGVQSIPTQIFFDADGKELFRHTGFFSKEDILAKYAELGVKL